MSSDLAAALDPVVARAAASVMGVVAMVTDRDETVYAGCSGARALSEPPAPMTEDAVFALFSATKPIAATACLRLMEAGALDLDAPAGTYVPEIDELQVLTGWDDDRPVLRPPARRITTRMLLLHTSGLGYDFTSEAYARLVKAKRVPPTGSGKRAALMTPLLFDPGEGWWYGSSLDWAGRVVEATAQAPLAEALDTLVLGPLGMTETSFTLTEKMRSRRVGMLRRGPDGATQPIDFAFPHPAEIHMGGHALYGTAGDYLRFIRLWLNDGRGPNGPLLRPDTVQSAARNGLGQLPVRRLKTANPRLAHDVVFFPGVRQGWGLSFLINEDVAPTGRSPGSLAWAGLANLYFWIDRARGLGGLWAAQLLPFLDPEAWAAYVAFETAVYAHGDR